MGPGGGDAVVSPDGLYLLFRSGLLCLPADFPLKC